MTIKSSRPYRRADYDSRAVDGGTRRPRTLSSARLRRTNVNREKYHSTAKQAAAQQETIARRPTSQSSSSPPLLDQTNLSLDVIHQPTKSVQLGVPVEVAVAITLNAPTVDGQARADTLDTSDLLATASLVSERCQGERVPLQTGFLTAPTLFDTVHPIQESQLELRTTSLRYRTILGYLSFPGLLIRQAGTFRIRTTLMRMGLREEAEATCLVAVDSRPIEVERHAVPA